MDAERYSQIRDLFFEATDQPRENIEAFVRDRAGGDADLANEVLAMVSLHDSDAARAEGDRVTVNPAELLKRNTTKTATGDSQSSNRGGGPAAVTKLGPERTYAEPVASNSSVSQTSSTARLPLWRRKWRRRFQSTGAWLYMAFLIPTAVIGGWTYHAIESRLRTTVRNEMSGVAEGVALSTELYLRDKAELALSWSRQPEIRSAVETLTEVSANSPDDPEALRSHPAVDEIALQLRRLADSEDVKFVFWDSRLRTIASWTRDRSDVGLPVAPGGAGNLSRAFSGQTVLFGPERLADDIPGFVPETQQPVVGVIVPIRSDDDRIIAAMLIRGLRWYEGLNELFREYSVASGVDCYAVSDRSVMLTASPRAVALAAGGLLDVVPGDIAAKMRIVDPGTDDLSPQTPVQRDVEKLTLAAADLRAWTPATPRGTVRDEPYPNYAGQSVVGTTRWLPRWGLGVIVEQSASTAFAPLRLVRNSYLLLASLLGLSSIVAAGRIAKKSIDEAAAVHPLSRYDVMETIGSGGMGMVYRARHRHLGRDAALKILRGDRHHPEDSLRFDREAKMASALMNPHSVTIYDYGRSPEGDAYCVMEYLRGLTLHQVVARSGMQPIGRVLSILQQCCDALGEAHHHGLCHRDIKPHNIMLSLDATMGDWVVVFDYGLAKPLETPANMFETTETIWAGTPMYMAPERFRNPSHLDPRSDLYALGAVGYTLLTGRPPYLNSEPESLFQLILNAEPINMELHREDLPPELSRLIRSMMAKDIDDRPRDAAEIAEQLDALKKLHPWSAIEAKQWWNLHGESAAESSPTTPFTPAPAVAER